MTSKFRTILSLTYLGSATVIIKYLSEIWQTTILMQTGGMLLGAYIFIKLFEKKIKIDITPIKAWILKILVWLISIMWAPLIGFTVAGVCLFILSFIFILICLMEANDFIELVESFFIELITDARFLGIIGIILLLFLGLSIYTLITDGWSGLISMF